MLAFINKYRPFRQYSKILVIFITAFLTHFFYCSDLAYKIYFINVAENLIGSADLILVPYQSETKPQTWKSKLFLNYTEIDTQYCQQHQSTIKGCTPRWILPASTHNTSFYLILLNQTKEIQLGFDRKQTTQQQLHGNEIIMSESMLNYLQLKEGQLITIQLNAEQIIKNVLEANQELVQEQNIDLETYLKSMLYMFGSDLQLKARIKSTIKEPKGKYPYTMGFVVLMDYSQFPISDYAQQVLVITQNRVSNYLSNFHFKFSRYANSLYVSVGLDYDMMVWYPLAKEITDNFKYSFVFQNILIGAFSFIFIIGIYLIYEEDTHQGKKLEQEIAMMRVLGATRWYLLRVFLVTFLTIIPAIILSELAIKVSEQKLTEFLQDELKESIKISNEDVIWKPIFFFGIVIPTVGLFIQLRKALSEMDLRRLIVPIWLRSTRERYYDRVQLQIIQLEKYGLSMWGCLISLVLIVNGYLAFYYVPRLIINNQIKKFSYAANFIFLLMLAGFSMIFNLIQLKFQSKMITLVHFLWNRFGRQKYICKEVMNYNLKTHQQYTRLLTLILILLNALLIFVGQGVKMQIESVTNSVKTNIGGDLTFESRGGQLLENEIRQYLINFSTRYPDALKEFTFHSEPMTDNVPFANFEFTINNHMKSQEGHIYDLRAVEENLLRSTYYEFYEPKNYDQDIEFNVLENGVKDGISGLYLKTNKSCFDFNYEQSLEERFKEINWDRSIINGQEGQKIREIPCIISSNFYNNLGLEVGSKFIMRMGKNKFYMRVVHTASRLPSFDRLFSDRTLDQDKQSILISMQAYDYLRQQLWGNQTNKEIDKYLENAQHSQLRIPKEKGIVRYQHQLNDSVRAELVEGLKYYLGDQILLYDVLSITHNLDKLQDVLTIVLLVINIIILSLSTFALITIFRNIIQSNKIDINILRAIGLTKNQISQSYILEAITVVMTAQLTGLILGILMSYILSFEFTLILRVPINQFTFPIEIVLSMLILTPLIVASILHYKIN